MNKEFKEFKESIPKISDFAYWFFWVSRTKLQVVKVDGMEAICYTNPQGTMFTRYGDNELPDDETTNAITSDLNAFQSRPEWYVGSEVDMNKTNYLITLLGCALIRAGRSSLESVDSMIDKFDRCMNWLEGTDFFVCPASTRYHGSYEGGLLEHSMQVVDVIRMLHDNNIFRQKVSLDTAVLCALTHDWCKIGLYEPYMRNVKDDNGNWVQKQEYKRSENIMMPLGHGVTSFYLVSRFFKLSNEEAAAIRWHQGVWNVCDMEQNDLQAANERWPLVHLLQFADQLSITSYM